MKKTAKEKKFPFEIGVRVRLVKSIRGSESVKFVGKIGTVSKIGPHQPHLADVKFDEHIGGTDTIVCSGDMLESAVLHESVARPQCPHCGYTEEDAALHMDHHLCKGHATRPWLKKPQPEPERGTALEMEMAIRFHEVYERLAPKFGYSTRQETRVFDPDSNNGRLMIATCKEVLLQMAPSPLPVREQTPAADELLAEVMHLWIDGYISKNPNSCADASISNETFAKISAHLDNVGIEVDYCGWSRKAGEKEE